MTVNDKIKTGDKVRVFVSVGSSLVPMHNGIVTEIRDGYYMVDRMSLHGGAPWICAERFVMASQSLRKSGRINPDFPTINFELGFRNTISKAQQQAVLEELKRIVPNLKYYLGIKWLSTYISIRPGELITLTEGNIDVANGYLYFPHPKEKRFKSVPILTEDVELLKSFNLTFPAMPFFRHPKGVKGTPENHPFSKNLLYSWWKKACSNINISGVDLYGGTRHSSARALRAYRTPEEIKRATMHTTNKAFERYFQIEAGDLRDIYRDTNHVVKIKEIAQNDK